jgi:uncharacterized protein (DUF58 family)
MAGLSPLRISTPPRVGRWLPVEGVVWLCILLLLFTVGIAKNINLVSLLASMLGAVLLVCAATVGRGLHRLRVHRALDEQVVAGMASQIILRVSLPAGPTLRGVCVEDCGTAHALSWYFDEVPGGGLEIRAAFVPASRGWYDFAPLAVSTRYPFGLVCRRVLAGPAMRVLVLPRPGKLSRDRLRQHLRGADPRGDRTQRRGWQHESAQADFHGLRPFRLGDNPRLIHWRTSARRGELLIREFEDEPGEDLFVAVDPACPPGDFEAVVGLAAALVHAWCRQRGDRLVFALGGLVLDGPTGPDHARALLEALALATPTAADTVAALDIAAAIGGRVAALVVSHGASDLPRLLESALGRPVAHLDVTRYREWGFYTPP